MKGRDIFYIDINEADETGLDAISLVQHPAVEVDFLCFSEETKEIDFSADEDRHILTAVALRADHPIYRRNGDYEYYVVFTKDVIRKLVTKYAKKNLFNSVNIEHNDYSFVKSAYMIESYIVDKERGIVPNEFSDIEDGSWIVSYYIDDNELWNEVKNTDTLNGVSVQGLFRLRDINDEEVTLSKQDHISLDDLINEMLEG